jgi:hypothetical protein
MDTFLQEIHSTTRQNLHSKHVGKMTKLLKKHFSFSFWWWGGVAEKGLTI